MPSDLGREHRFAADVGVKEELGVWQEGAHAVQPTNGKRGAFQQALPVSGEIEGRLRRDRGSAPAAAGTARRHSPFHLPWQWCRSGRKRCGSWREASIRDPPNPKVSHSPPPKDPAAGVSTMKAVCPISSDTQKPHPHTPDSVSSAGPRNPPPSPPHTPSRTQKTSAAPGEGRRITHGLVEATGIEPVS